MKFTQTIAPALLSLGLLVSNANASLVYTVSDSAYTSVNGSDSFSLDLSGYNFSNILNSAIMTVTHSLNDTAYDDHYYLNGTYFGTSSTSYPGESAEIFNVTSILSSFVGTSINGSVSSYDYDGFYDDGASWTFSLSLDYDEAPVSEPGTLALLGLGLAAIGFARKKKAA